MRILGVGNGSCSSCGPGVWPSAAFGSVVIDFKNPGTSGNPQVYQPFVACRRPWTRAAAAGIEPASGRLTAAYPYQHGTRRNGDLYQLQTLRRTEGSLPSHRLSARHIVD